MSDQRDQHRPAGTWRSVARTMAAAATLRLLLRLIAIVAVGAILLVLGWHRT